MTERRLRRLLSDRILERVEPDEQTARDELRVARAHVETAALVAERDPTAAFAVGYDAMRKAISAHMRAGTA